VLGAFTACVKIPGEVEAAFAPAQPGERSNFRRQPSAPSALGFVTDDDMRLPDAGVAPGDASPATTVEAGAAPTPAITLVDAAPQSSSAAPAAGDGGAPRPDGGTP
jgi:hypothetical protein